MSKDKSIGKNMADMMYGNNEALRKAAKPALGIYPMVGKRREDRQDREAAKSFPLDLGRGLIAGAGGIFGDFESLARLPYELITGNESPTFLPTSDDLLKRIPFGSDTPVGNFAAGLGALAGGSANLSPLYRGVKAVPGALKAAARNLSKPDTLNPQAGVIKPRGGNFIGGRLMGNMDESVSRLKPYRMAGDDGTFLQKDLRSAKYRLEILQSDPYKNDAMVAGQKRTIEDIEKKIAVNNWVTNNLGKYTKNQMATPEDPIRLLLDKRTKEIDTKHAKDMERAERVSKRAMDEPDPRRQANLIRESERLKLEANVERQFAMDSIIPSRMQDYPPEADYYLKQRRQEAGFPAEGMGQSEAAKRFETLTDDAISTMRAGDVQETKGILAQAQDAERAVKTKQLEVAKRFDEQLRASGLNENEIRVLNEKTPITEKADIIQDREYGELSYAYNKLRTDIRRDEFAVGQENPFIDKLDPETTLYSGNTADMGFDHVIDILKQDVMEGRIRPEQLSKVSVEDAVRRTMEFDQEAARKMAETQIKATEGFPVVKEYPEGYRWIELAPRNVEELRAVHADFVRKDFPNLEGADPAKFATYVEDSMTSASNIDQKKLADALKYEGDTMGHCVGGYCPDVVAGKSRIYSLRDAKGEPHVTIEAAPHNPNLEAVYAKQNLPELYAKYSANRNEYFNSWTSFLKKEAPELLDATETKIVQIKGKQNARPIEKYDKYTQDFVKSGTYSSVGDLQNTGLIRKSDLIDKFSPDELDSIGAGEYLTKGEQDDLLLKALNARSPGLTDELGLTTPPPAPDGMARGGAVHFSDNPDVMQLELARGGAVRMQAGGLPKRLIEGGVKAFKALKPAKEEVKPSLVIKNKPGLIVSDLIDEDPEIAKRMGALARAKRQAAAEAEGKRRELARQTEPSVGYRKTTLQNPDPLVGTRFINEAPFGLSPNDPFDLSKFKGASGLVLPWDSQSRNVKTTQVSGVDLPNQIFRLTHGGVPYSFDTQHAAQGIVGSSGELIANRVKTRSENAIKENKDRGGTGEVLHFPITMGLRGEDYALPYSEFSFDIINQKLMTGELTLKQAEELSNMVRNYTPPEKKYKGKKPFSEFAGFTSPEGLDQIYTGQGLKVPSGELRKAIADRIIHQKSSQEKLGFNAEDLTNATTYEPLRGVDKGFIGSSVMRNTPSGMRLTPSAGKYPYDTDFSGEHLGRLEDNVNAEALFYRTLNPVKRELMDRETVKPYTRESLNRAAIAAIEKRNENVSQMIDQQFLDDYGTYITELRKPTEYRKGGAVRKAAGGEITADDLILEERKL